MGEQQSKKRSVKSDARKRAGTQREFDPMPASGPAAGASGKHPPDRSGKEGAPGMDSGRRAMRQKDWSKLERKEDV